MAGNEKENVIVYQARLHWILFFGPVALVMVAWIMNYYLHAPHQLGWAVGAVAVAAVVALLEVDNGWDA